MRPRKVLVTGASGFIGGRVVERLALQSPSEVCALVHKWSRAARIARFPIQIAAADILDERETVAAMEGVTHVIHCAVSGSPAETMQATRNLLAAAHAAGIERFVYVSTAEVYGAQAAGLIDETAPTEHTGRAYGDSKIDAEAACREFNARGLSTTIIRPAIVYGPFGRSWTIGVATRLLSGRWNEFEGYGDGICNAIYVDDLASVLLLALDHPAAAGETFNVNGTDTGTWNQYFRKLNTAIGLAPLVKKSATTSARRSAVMSRIDTVIRSFVRRFEDRLMEVYLRGGFASRVMKRVKTILDSTPSPAELEDLYSRSATYSDQKARDLLGFRPEFTLDRGMALCVAWMRASGYLPSAAAQTTTTSPTANKPRQHDHRIVEQPETVGAAAE